MADNQQQKRNKKYGSEVPHSEDWPEGARETPSVRLPRDITSQGRQGEFKNPWGGTRKQVGGDSDFDD